MNPVKESKIESWLNKQVAALGGISYKFTSPDNPGVPDRIYIFPGGAVYFVELKAEFGRLAKLQKWQGARLEAAGCRYRVVKGMLQAESFVKELEEAHGRQNQ